MDIIVRPMHAGDRGVWAQMRAALWPQESAAAHARAIDALLPGSEAWGSEAWGSEAWGSEAWGSQAWGFIAEAPDGGGAGFAEIAIRKYANGCDSAPVAFLEGVWVEPQYRRRGIGTRLIAHVESFVAARGFCELGSDTQIDNAASQAAHVVWGFSETERVVYFRKLLKPPAG
jgi:aminoglycoside 6'-N-acetyltransferase I